MIADQRLYLNADKSAIVHEGDADAAFLLAAEGEEIPEEFAKLAKPAKAASKPADKQAAAPENKGK